MPDVPPQRVLVTGSAGAIGRVVCRALGDRGHAVVGFDRHENPDLDEQVIGDLAHADPVWRAVTGADTVVHLGAYPNDADFLGTLLPSNILGAWHVAEAAAALGVRRLILASSMQVISGRPGWQNQTVGVDEPPEPRNAYALTKCFAEDLGRLMANRHGLSALSVRIGWLPRSPGQSARIGRSAASRAVYLSDGDAGRFFTGAVEADRPAAGEHAIVFATSRAADYPRLDPEPARRLIGYEAQDVHPEV